ncbi:hypothetical protein ACWGQ5_45325 [Streptomyces sp. NPDC055722]
MNTQPTLALNNGIGVPQLGFGVYQSPEGADKSSGLVKRHVGTHEGFC